jgi:hypothetical protein
MIGRAVVVGIGLAGLSVAGAEAQTLVGRYYEDATGVATCSSTYACRLNFWATLPDRMLRVTNVYANCILAAEVVQ